MKKIRLIVIGGILVGISCSLMYFRGNDDKLQIKNDNNEIPVVKEKVKEVPNGSENLDKKLNQSLTETGIKNSDNKKSNKKSNLENSDSKQNTNLNELNDDNHKNNDLKKENTNSKQNEVLTDSANENNVPKNESTNSSDINKDSFKQEEVKKDEVVKFYESITHGKKEFSSESQALARGLEIANRELDYVLNYNMEHVDNQIKPSINYYRVYPYVIDADGKTWYYLHFFCENGVNNDDKLKKMF